jgi:uncharacterized protein (TIGR03000 family)
MYGVVLMMALSGGADQPAWTEAAGEHVAKYGDHGQKEYRGCHGRRGRRGCCGGGGCYGGGGYGCCGGGWGYGGYGYGGCSGGYGYGGWGYGSMPYAGGYYGYSPYSGATYSGYSQFGTPTDYGYGVPANQAGGYYNQSNAERLGAPQTGEAPATLVVRLPADAKLTIEGAPTTSTNDVRWFISPPLQAGKDYQYTLKAEVTRDGKKVERTREVTVRAGQQNEVTIDLPAGSGPPRE